MRIIHISIATLISTVLLSASAQAQIHFQSASQSPPHQVSPALVANENQPPPPPPADCDATCAAYPVNNGNQTVYNLGITYMIYSPYLPNGVDVYFYYYNEPGTPANCMKEVCRGANNHNSVVSCLSVYVNQWALVGQPGGHWVTAECS